MEDPKGIVEDVSRGASTGAGILEEFAVLIAVGIFLAGVLVTLAVGHFVCHWK